MSDPHAILLEMVSERVDRLKALPDAVTPRSAAMWERTVAEIGVLNEAAEKLQESRNASRNRS